MYISIKELKEMCQEIFSRVDAGGFSGMDMDDIDYYWQVLDMTDMNVKDPKLGVGSFIDDVIELRKAVEKKHPVSLVDFDRLGNIIRILGEQIEKKRKIFIDTNFDEEE